MAATTTQGTGPGSAADIKPKILNGTVRTDNLAVEAQVMRVYGGTNFASAPATLEEVMPETVIFDGNDDDDYIEAEIGFPITFAGDTYTAVYVGSNSYITFGDGSSVYSRDTYEGWANLLPGVYVGADDNSYQTVLTNETVGEPGSRTTTIRYQGTNSTSGDSENPNIVWEITFHEADPSRIDLNVLAYDGDGEVEGEDFFTLVADGMGGYTKITPAPEMPKLTIRSEVAISTGKSIQFTDRAVKVVKSEDVLVVDTSSYGLVKQNDIGDDNYTLKLSDSGKHIYAYDCTITVPYQYDVDFPTGTKITVVTQGDSVVIQRDGSDTTIWANGSDYGSYTVGQRSVVHLFKTDDEVWCLYGDNITVND